MVQIPTNDKHMPAVAPQPPRTWSPYQQALFADAASGQGNRIVRAVAGSGKTTTGVEMCALVRGSHVYLAFNKTIATELSKRGVNGRTFHSMCYRVVLEHLNIREVTPDKLRRLCAAKFTGDDLMVYGTFAQRLVSLARNAGIGCLVPDTEAAWVDLCAHYDIEPDSDLAEFGRGITLARELLEWSNDSNMVDFDDLLYLSVKEGLVLPRFDNVFVDEAQDTNAIQRALIRKMMKDTSRLFAVGDEAQAIYGFRGADSDSMALLKREFDCVDMPLTVTYRCPRAVVEYASQWVAHLEAAPNAQEGQVVPHGHKWSVADFVANDLVVCRTTAPVVALAYKLLKAHVPCYVLGREIGQGLKNLVHKMRALDLEQLDARLEEWELRECEKARAKQNDAKVEAIHDKASAIRCLIESLDEDNRSVAALLQVIDRLFSDKANAVVLCTIHRAKGLEADRVFWLNSSKCPAKWARLDWQVQQEHNLCYVAATRAKQSLHLIEMHT